MAKAPRKTKTNVDKSVGNVEKTPAKSSVRMRVPKHGGGKLQIGGTPGNSGGTGRPPDAWKALCRELASRDEMLTIAKEVLADKHHPAWLGAWKFLGEQAYGKAPQAVDVTSGGEPVKQVLIIGDQRIEF